MRIFNTQNYKVIHQACTKTLNDKSISIILGATGTGKTVALTEFAKDRNDVVVISKPIVRSRFSESVKLIVVDGMTMDWTRYVSGVQSMISRNQEKGFVISMKYNPFVSKSETIRELAYKLVKHRAEVTEIMGEGPMYQFRTRIKLVGAIKALKSSEFKRHFVIAHKLRHSLFPILSQEQAAHNHILNMMRSYKTPTGLNTIYCLRRPTRQDVEGICQFFGLSSSSSIYQRSQTLSEVLKKIQWKQSQKAK